MHRLSRPAAVWAAPILLMALIFAFSAMPSDDVDRGALQFLLRKVLHFTEYALLLVLWWRALRTQVSANVALGIALSITLVYAGTDEWHQSYVDGRVGTPWDVLLDATGAAAGAALILRRGQVVRA